MTDRAKLAAFRESMADEPWFEVRVRGGFEALRDALDAAKLDTQIVHRTPKDWSTLTPVPKLGDEYTPAEATLNRIFDRLPQRIREIIMTSAENAATGVADQLSKAKGEIDGVIADLQDQSVTPATIQRLQNLSQALDDVVPDAAPAEPTPAEPTPPADGATDTST